MNNCCNCKHLKCAPYLALDDGRALYTYWCEKNLIKPNEIKFDCEEFKKKYKYDK